MSDATASFYREPPRRDGALWVVAAAVVLALHVGLALLLVYRQPQEPKPPSGEVVEVDLTPPREEQQAAPQAPSAQQPTATQPDETKPDMPVPPPPDVKPEPVPQPAPPPAATQPAPEPPAPVPPEAAPPAPARPEPPAAAVPVPTIPDLPVLPKVEAPLETPKPDPAIEAQKQLEAQKAEAARKQAETERQQERREQQRQQKLAEERAEKQREAKQRAQAEAKAQRDKERRDAASRAAEARGRDQRNAQRQQASGASLAAWSGAVRARVQGAANGYGSEGSGSVSFYVTPNGAVTRVSGSGAAASAARALGSVQPPPDHLGHPVSVRVQVN